MEHSWECVAQLLRGGHTADILCDVGMPVIHRGTCPSVHADKCLTSAEHAGALLWMQVCATTAASSCWTAGCCSSGPSCPWRMTATTGTC